MSKWTIYHNPKCSKSREALAALKDRGIEPEVVEYLRTAPSEMELKNLIQILQGPASEMVRVKEDDFKTSPFDLNSADLIAQNLSKNPRLLERPIVIKDGRAVVARPLEKIDLLLK